MSTAISVRLPRPLHAEITRRAEAQGTSVGEAVRDLLRTAVEIDDLSATVARAAERGAYQGIQAALADDADQEVPS